MLNTRCPASSPQDYYEPNDSVPFAAALEVSYPFGIKCARTVAGEDDWFKVTTRFAGTLNIKIYASANVVADVYGAGNLITPLASETIANGTITIPGAATGNVYYVRFRQAATNASYTMFLCSGACPAEFNFP